MEAQYGRLDAAATARLIQQLPVGQGEAESTVEDSVIRGVVLVVSDLEVRLVTGSAENPGPAISLAEES